MSASGRWRARRRRPERAAWSGPLAGATFLAGLGGAIARSEHPYPRPGASPEDIHTYFAQPSRAPWISVTGQLSSAASLIAWTGVVARLARGNRPLHALAVAGGAASAAALGTSAACTAALAIRSEDPARAVRLHRTAFVAGGPLHGAGFGLLLTALALAGRSSARLPAPLTRAALAAAAPNLASPAYLAWPPAVWLIPGGRFPGLIITGAAGTVLARG